MKQLFAQKATIFSAALAASLALGGCASTAPKNDDGAVGQVHRESIQDADPKSVPAQSAARPSRVGINDGHLEVWGQRLKNSRFDLPVVINPRVEHWIAYFTGKGRNWFQKYLERGRYFIPEISKILKAHNMPQDLVYLAMIESGFNNSAKSRAKAVGPWQFIRPTGQRYGMRVDYWLDERRDTRKSTLAAIAYLKELYEEFGSWELAAAGYNAGENKVRRAIAKYKVYDFWEISRHRFFRPETRDYVPKLMAAAILTKNAEQFGFVNPFNSKVPNPTVLLASNDEDAETEEPTPKELGEPEAKSEDTAEDAAETPGDKIEELAQEAEEDDEAEDLADNHAVVSQSPMAAITPSVYMVNNPNEQILEFEIKGPADLFAISKASGLPYSALKMLNPELLRWCTPPDMKTYRIKLPKSVKDRFLATYNDESFDRRVVFMQYKVRKGDTVQTVARRYGTEASPIREINAMGSRINWLRAGSSIALPVPTGYKRVIASQYDDKPVTSSRRKRRIRRTRRSRTKSATEIRYRMKPSFGKAKESNRSG